MIRFREPIQVIQEAAIQSNTGWVKSRLAKLEKSIRAVVKNMGAPNAKGITAGNKKIVGLLTKAFIDDGVFIGYNHNDMSGNEDEDEVGLNGGFTAMGEKAPIMVIYLNKNLWQAVSTPNNWRYFVNRFADIIGHEQVHRAQYARAKSDGRHMQLVKHFQSPNPGKTPEDKIMAYMSDKHEIMAWATTAFLELIGRGYTNEEILTVIKNPFKHLRALERSNSMMTYMDNFDKNSPVLKRFFKVMYQLATGAAQP